jgi:hypothetical protein
MRISCLTVAVSAFTSLSPAIREASSSGYQQRAPSNVRAPIKATKAQESHDTRAENALVMVTLPAGIPGAPAEACATAPVVPYDSIGMS